MKRIIQATFKYLGQTYVVKGRFAETLLALSRAGAAGVTALEMSSWALRLGHYVWVLRHRYGLPIDTAMEPHDGGHHARYTMLTGDLEITAVQYRDQERAAA